MSEQPWHSQCVYDRAGSEDPKKKGGESNEKERISSMQPAPVLDTVLGCAVRGGRRIDLQSSCRHHHRLLPSKVPGDTRGHSVMGATDSRSARRQYGRFLRTL